MKKTDLDNNDELRAILEAVFEQIRQARRLILNVDIVNSKANLVQYKGSIQWLDDSLRRLTFED
jgi:hypothetical protein